MYISVCCVLNSSNHVWLFATPWTVAHQAPLSLGILQARILEGVVMPSSRGSSQARDRIQVSLIAGGFFTIWATRESHNVHPGLPLTLDDSCAKCTWCRFATHQRDSGFGLATLEYWYVYLAFGIEGKASACNSGDPGSIPGSGRSPGEGNGNPLQYSCLENPQGQRSLVGCSPWGSKESDVSEWLSTQRGSFNLLP